MLSKIKIGNFKSIEKLELELAPLTIFVGPNASGKSNVLEILAFLKQSLNSEPTFKGNLVDLGDLREVVYKRDEDRWTSIGLVIGLSSSESMDLSAIVKDMPEITKTLPGGPSFQINNLEYEISFRKSPNNYREFKHSISASGLTLLKVGLIEEDGSWHRKTLYPRDLSKIEPENVLNVVLRNDIFRLGNRGDTLALSKAVANAIGKRVEKLYYISALRGDIPRTSPTGGEPTWVGARGEYITQLLSIISGSREFEDKKKKIIEWAGKFELLNISAGWIGDNQLRSYFKDPKLNTILNPASSGQGSRQILPIIVQLFYSDPESVILIEEPEMSLHLESQLNLPKMFSDAIKEEKQVIITTHSEHLILALKPLIVNGELKPEDVAIWHFEKTAEGTKAEKLNLTEQGIIKGWIPSYVKAEGEIIKEWFDTLPED